MKKRMSSLLPGLCVSLMLLVGTALAVESGPTVTLCGKILSEGLYEVSGSVVTPVEDVPESGNYLQYTPGEGSGTLTVFGSVKAENAESRPLLMVSGGKLTVTGNDSSLTLINLEYSPLYPYNNGAVELSGSVDLKAVFKSVPLMGFSSAADYSGDIEITAAEGANVPAVWGGLDLMGANKVAIHSCSNAPIFGFVYNEEGTISIQATGAVSLRNTGHGVKVDGDLKIKGASVELAGGPEGPVVFGPTEIESSGDVSIISNGYIAASPQLNITSGGNVTIFNGRSTSPTISIGSTGGSMDQVHIQAEKDILIQDSYANQEYYDVVKPNLTSNQGQVRIEATGNIGSITGIHLNQPNRSLVVGDSIQLEVYTLPSYLEYDGAVTWSSSAPSVAAVNSDGRVTAAAPGTATITAVTENGGFSDSCTVQVCVDTSGLTGIRLDKNDQTLKVGDGFWLDVYSLPDDVRYDGRVNWSSSNSSVVSTSDFSNSAYIRGAAPGTATITATTEDGRFSASCTVRVVDFALEYDSLFLGTGESKRIDVAKSSSVSLNGDLIWTSSDKSVVKLRSTSNYYASIEAIAPGTATITAATQDGKYSASCVVTVADIPVTGIDMASNPLLFLLDSSYHMLYADIIPYNATCRAIAWTSGDESVVHVDDCYAWAVAPGWAEITATTMDGGYTASRPVAVVSLLNRHRTSIAVGETRQLEISVQPADVAFRDVIDYFSREIGDDGDPEEVVWSSSNEEVVSVSETGEITAHKPGTATITLSVNGWELDCCAVTVTGAVAPGEEELLLDVSQCFEEGQPKTIVVSVDGVALGADPVAAWGEPDTDEPDAIEWRGFKKLIITGEAEDVQIVFLNDSEDRFGGLLGNRTVTFRDLSITSCTAPALIIQTSYWDSEYILPIYVEGDLSLKSGVAYYEDIPLAYLDGACSLISTDEGALEISAPLQHYAVYIPSYSVDKNLRLHGFSQVRLEGGAAAVYSSRNQEASLDEDGEGYPGDEMIDGSAVLVTRNCGDVTVKGDIEGGIDLEARGNVRIDGMVVTYYSDPRRIIAGGNVFFSCFQANHAPDNPYDPLPLNIQAEGDISVDMLETTYYDYPDDKDTKIYYTEEFIKERLQSGTGNLTLKFIDGTALIFKNGIVDVNHCGLTVNLAAIEVGQTSSWALGGGTLNVSRQDKTSYTAVMDHITMDSAWNSDVLHFCYDGEDIQERLKLDLVLRGENTVKWSVVPAVYEGEAEESMACGVVFDGAVPVDVTISGSGSLRTAAVPYGCGIYVDGNLTIKDGAAIDAGGGSGFGILCMGDLVIDHAAVTASGDYLDAAANAFHVRNSGSLKAEILGVDSDDDAWYESAVTGLEKMIVCRSNGAKNCLECVVFGEVSLPDRPMLQQECLIVLWIPKGSALTVSAETAELLLEETRIINDGTLTIPERLKDWVTEGSTGTTHITANAVRLMEPSDLYWDQYVYLTGDGQKGYEWFIGAISWMEPQDQPEHSVEIAVYRTGSRNPVWISDGESLLSYSEVEGECSTYDFALDVLSEQKQEGEYYFTVRLKGDGVNTVSSAAVKSDSRWMSGYREVPFKPYELAWEQDSAVWKFDYCDEESYHDESWIVDGYYSPTEGDAVSTTGLEHVSRTILLPNSIHNWGPADAEDVTKRYFIPGKSFWKDQGYYYFTVYTQSGDEFSLSGLSPAFNFDGNYSDPIQLTDPFDLRWDVRFYTGQSGEELDVYSPGLISWQEDMSQPACKTEIKLYGESGEAAKYIIPSGPQSENQVYQRQYFDYLHAEGADSLTGKAVSFFTVQLKGDGKSTYDSGVVRSDLRYYAEGKKAYTPENLTWKWPDVTWTSEATDLGLQSDYVVAYYYSPDNASATSPFELELISCSDYYYNSETKEDEFIGNVREPYHTLPAYCRDRSGYYYFTVLDFGSGDDVCGPSDLSALSPAYYYNGGSGEEITHQHKWSQAWSKDAGGHWHECGGCEETDGFAAHTPGEWVIDIQATATMAGSRHKACTVCGYITRTESIPATGSDSGGGEDTPPVEPDQPSQPTTPSTPGTPSVPGSSGSSDFSGASSAPPVSTDRAAGDSTSAVETTAKPAAVVKDGTAATAVSSAVGSEIVKQAEKNKSSSVVIAPEIKEGVNKTEVSIPASTVAQIGGKTEANLTVSTPVASVDIPNEVLGELAKSGGNVKVTAERNGSTVELSITADGKAVDEISGGVTVTVPVEEPKPGTVAMLVHEDGTREVIRKSVTRDGSLEAPLNGSARIEIVDNSKEFSDVPADSWAADAVSFSSARELFSGTDENTFAPDEPMSRSMLMNVLARFDGEETAGGSTWYEKGMDWAVSKGISDGSDPDGNISREQVVAMLWRYAGSPAPGKTLDDFADASLVSDYAKDAMSWAVENGIIGGYGDGQLGPQGHATRAQVAQLLKNFIEM